VSAPEFPKMLYRPGADMQWDNRGVDTCVVADAQEQADELADGWFADAVALFDAIDNPASKVKGKGA